MNHFIFFHVVGIRSHFWDTIIPKLEKKSLKYSLIYLDFTSLDSALESSISSVKEIEKIGSAFYLKDKFQRTVSRLIEMRSK